MVVVLPTPFTPTTSITLGEPLRRMRCLSSFNKVATYALRNGKTSSGDLISRLLAAARTAFIIFSVVFTPTSPAMRTISSSSKKSSSISVDKPTRVSILSVKFFLVLDNPSFNLSKNPMFYPFSSNFTDNNLEIPDSSIVIPCSTSAASITPLR
ncbi:hypothetical protein SDC9_127293 [bioreactor metagenome]|uniref:Uncharacterized protein n=1 Tax=bioreactor metagenome TaxID=1076179 RepID=A0A645CSZ5_9ZZZZ